jgi:hypothetical protein
MPPGKMGNSAAITERQYSKLTEAMLAETVGLTNPLV